MLKYVRDYYLLKTSDWIHKCNELILHFPGPCPDQLSKECASFRTLSHGDVDELGCSLPKPCSHVFCHIRSRARSSGVDRDRTGVGSCCWMPSPQWCRPFGSHAHFTAGQQVYSTGKVDGRVDYGLAGSPSCSCRSKRRRLHWTLEWAVFLPKMWVLLAQ